MTLSVEHLSRGDTRIAVIAHTTISAHGRKDRATVFCEKVPVAILIRSGGTPLAFAPSGRPLTRDAVEARAPGLWASVFDD